jgi:hypothetical protein
LHTFEITSLTSMTISGWSHFAQFTIAVGNMDPKKVKYSGELNLVCSFPRKLYVFPCLVQVLMQ